MHHPSTDIKCEQRIDKHLSNRLAQLIPDLDSWTISQCKHFLKSEGYNITGRNAAALRDAVKDTIQNQARESLLAIEKKQTFRLCLSWGGPSDYFEIDWSETQETWTGGRYLFQDWFDGASRSISSEVAEQLAEVFAIYV